MTVPEPIDAATYRRALGMAWLTIPFCAMNFAWYFMSLGVPGYDPVVFRKGLAGNVPCHVVCLTLWLVSRHRNVSDAVLRTFVKIFILAIHSCVLASIWVNLGTIRSIFCIFFTMLAIAWMRGMLDAGLGLFAYVTAMIFETTFAVLQLTGIVSTESLQPSAVDATYLHWQGRLTMLFWQLAVYTLAWIFTSDTVKRMRETDWILASERAARRKLEQRVVEREAGRLAGTTLPPGYVLRELLGRGAMGEVYEASRPSDGATVAIKILASHLAGSEQMLARFRRETEILSLLPSSCATRVQAYGTTAEGDPFFVMDRLRGEDLGALLRRRRVLPVTEALALIGALAHALNVAHEAGVIHRDLKPQNIFVGGGTNGELPSVRLLDFGISRLVGDTEGLTQTSFVLGSPGYLAPEQARGASFEIGPHTDVFALGVIAYRLLTGENAFRARDVTGALFEAVHVDPTAPSQVCGSLSPAFDAVLAIALAKRVDERYARAPEFARDLDLAYAGQLPTEVVERARALQKSQSPEPRISATMTDTASDCG